MKLGFIGTGVITEAIVTGLVNSDYPATEIRVSKRGEAISARLSQCFNVVQVCMNNQEIIDRSDIVFLAVLPKDAEAVLSALKFDERQQVASLIAALTHEQLQNWIGANCAVTRAIPLPAVAENKGVTAIYPHSDLMENLFSHLGSVVSAKTLDEFDAIATASAMMGTCFGILEAAAQWLTQNGVEYDDGRAYLSTLFQGLAGTMVKENQSAFSELRVGHSTPGGLNQQLYEVFEKQGGVTALADALESVAGRIRRSR